MNLIKMKKYLFDKRNISYELYRPLIYWFYVLNPFKKTGKVNFPSIKEMNLIMDKIEIEKKNLF